MTTKITSANITTSTSTIFSNTTAATSSTNGALQVVGGVGVGGDLYVGGKMSLGTNNNLNTLEVGKAITVNGVGNVSFGRNNYGLMAYGGAANGLYFMTFGNSNTALGTFAVYQLSGNLSVNTPIFVNTSSQIILGVNYGTYSPTTNSTATVVINGSMYISTTTNSTSTNTGALQVAGGVGIGGSVHISSGTSIYVGGKQTINGPAFSAYANATLQTITSGSQQKVLFQVEEFDTNNNYASSTFTPTVAGYYQLNAEVRLDGASGTGEMMIVLWKNGAEYKRGTNQQGTQIAANFWAMQVSTLVYANGISDYFEIYVQQGLGSSVTVTAVNNPAITWFNGAMVRGA